LLLGEKVKAFGGSLKGMFGKISKKVRILLIVFLVVLIVGALAFTLIMNNQPYTVLFADLSSSDVSAIMSYLEQSGVRDYRLEDSDTILVPENQEAYLKSRILMEGYPNSGFSYSAFYDNVGALSTESERNSAYIIALQERMGAVICCLEGVKEAYVTIAQGEDRSYVLDSGNIVGATASVVVTMQDGRQLSEQHAEAIRNLVARAVQGLEIDSVSIVDSLGNVYTGGDSIGQKNDASELKLRLEQENSNKIRTQVMQVLTPIFGEENVRVSVNCIVDVNYVIENVTDVYLPPWAEDGSTDGEGIIGSVVYDHYIIRGDDEVVGGAVGTETNADLPTYVKREANADGDEREIGVSGQIDFDNPRKDTYIERTAGSISDVTVSVSINSRQAAGIETAAIRNHVARAAGISAAGLEGITEAEYLESKISVLSAPFYVEPSVVPPILPGSDIPEWAIYAAAGGLLLFILLLVLLLILRRRRKKKRAALNDAERVMREIRANIEASPLDPIATDGMNLRTEKGLQLRQDIRQFADDNPELASQMLRAMLRGGEENG